MPTLTAATTQCSFCLKEPHRGHPDRGRCRASSSADECVDLCGQIFADGPTGTGTAEVRLLGVDGRRRSCSRTCRGSRRSRPRSRTTCTPGCSALATAGSAGHASARRWGRRASRPGGRFSGEDLTGPVSAVDGTGRTITSSPSSVEPRSWVKPTLRQHAQAGAVLGLHARPDAYAGPVGVLEQRGQRLGDGAVAASVLDQPEADLGLLDVVDRRSGRRRSRSTRPPSRRRCARCAAVPSRRAGRRP